MSSHPAWLPPLVLLQDHGKDKEAYLNAVYAFFRLDFVESSPSFQGVRLALKRHPLRDGKEATFWHLTTEGSDEFSRTLDIDRCERIRWPRPIIERDQAIKCWRNSRKNNEPRICLWLEDAEYLVVLAERRGYILLWTAYPVREKHRKDKLEKEFQAYKKANAAP